jgi:hypothetical protein
MRVFCTVSKLQSAQDSLYNLVCFALALKIRAENPSLSDDMIQPPSERGRRRLGI